MKIFLLLAASFLLLGPANLAKAQQKEQDQSTEKEDSSAQESKKQPKETNQESSPDSGGGLKGPAVVIIDGKAYTVTPTTLLNQDELFFEEDAGSFAPRLDPNAKPLTAEEYLRKKAAYQAKVLERERLERENLRKRQEAIEAEAAARDTQGADAAALRVGVRKDLEPLPERPTVDPQMAKSMATWYRTYQHAIRPFKNHLGQVLTLVNTRSTLARRDACRNLYVSSEALLESKALAAPDAAVRDPAMAMAQKFHQAAYTCLEGKAEAAKGEMQQAEKDLAAMANALSLYSLVP